MESTGSTRSEDIDAASLDSLPCVLPAFQLQLPGNMVGWRGLGSRQFKSKYLQLAGFLEYPMLLDSEVCLSR